jgi:hypothetical protein
MMLNRAGNFLAECDAGDIFTIEVGDQLVEPFVAIKKDLMRFLTVILKNFGRDFDRRSAAQVHFENPHGAENIPLPEPCRGAAGS